MTGFIKALKILKGVLGTMGDSLKCGFRRNSTIATDVITQANTYLDWCEAAHSKQ